VFKNKNAIEIQTYDKEAKNAFKIADNKIQLK
jgi:hypothetical protein